MTLAGHIQASLGFYEASYYASEPNWQHAGRGDVNK